MEAIVASAYFGPVQWYQKLNRYGKVWIERYDNYLKQTYRNRCIIATTAGTQALTIPVEGYDTLKCRMKDIRISDHGRWRHLHWNALQTAYGESPFFEFYEDDIRPFYEKKWDFLFDFNMETTEKICELIDIRPGIAVTEEYMDPQGRKDFRDMIRPKHPLPDPEFTPKRYYQVYEAKIGFKENISILDLLFNMGPESIFYL